MSYEPLPFALPDVGEQEIEAVSNVIRSGWLSSGPKAREFEAEFAQAIGPGVEAISVNSATAGLHLAAEGCGIGPGDEVLIPTWTFTASAEVIRYLGARPVLVDVKRESLNIDLADAEAKCTDRTRAIMPVHFAGLPVDYESLNTFARQRSLEVIEDAAHAFPASSGGIQVGNGASIATVFSFYATKTMTTGEGGMLVTNQPSLARRARIMRLHGIDRDAFDRYRSKTPAWYYEVVAPGFKYNMTDIAAALGLVQLERARSMRDRRAAIAAAYHKAFSHTDLVLPASDDRTTVHSWHLYVVRVPDRISRNRFIRALAGQGIGTSVHFIPLHMHPYWRTLDGKRLEDFPVASSEYERVVSLPIYSRMSDADVGRVIESVIGLM